LKNRKSIPLIIYLVVLAVAFTWMSGIFAASRNTIPYSQVVSMFEQEQVKSFVVQGDTLTMNLTTPYDGKTTVSTTLSDPEGFRQEMADLFREQHDAGILQSYDFVASKGFSPYDLVLPLLIVGLILLFYLE